MNARPRAIVAALAVLVLLAVAGWQLREVQQHRSLEHRRDAAVATATRVAAGFTSLTAAGSKSELAKLSADLSPSLRRQLTSDDSAVGRVLTSSAVESSSKVVLAGAEKVGARSATVLVAVTAQVRNTSAPKGEQRLYRFEVSLIREGDRWFADKLELVP